jgi:hypothetical protein
VVDSFIPATPGSGVNVETSALTRSDGTTVQRERVTVGDPVNVGNLAPVGPRGLAVDAQTYDLLQQILVEQRVMNMLLAQAFGITDSLDTLRNDQTIPTQIPS